MVACDHFTSFRVSSMLEILAREWLLYVATRRKRSSVDGNYDGKAHNLTHPMLTELVTAHS